MKILFGKLLLVVATKFKNIGAKLEQYSLSLIKNDVHILSQLFLEEERRKQQSEKKPEQYFNGSQDTNEMIDELPYEITDGSIQWKSKDTQC